MIKKLIKLANHLDKKGFTKEASYLDVVISKLAEDINEIKPLDMPEERSLLEEEMSLADSVPTIDLEKDEVILEEDMEMEDGADMEDTMSMYKDFALTILKGSNEKYMTFDPSDDMIQELAEDLMQTMDKETLAQLLKSVERVDSGIKSKEESLFDMEDELDI